jgi:hypothetical protein
MKWDRHVARIKVVNTIKMLLWKPEWKSSLADFGVGERIILKTPRKIIIILIYCTKFSVITVDDILKNVIIDIWLCRDGNGGRSLTKWDTLSFSRATLHDAGVVSPIRRPNKSIFWEYLNLRKENYAKKIFVNLHPSCISTVLKKEE